MGPASALAHRTGSRGHARDRRSPRRVRPALQRAPGAPRKRQQVAQQPLRALARLVRARLCAAAKTVRGHRSPRGSAGRRVRPTPHARFSASLDGVIGQLEQTIQAQRDARHRLTRASTELERADEEERAALARGRLGAATRMPLQLVALTAGFLDRHVRIVAGLVILVIALIFWLDQRLFFIAIAIGVLRAGRVYMTVRPG